MDELGVAGPAGPEWGDALDEPEVVRASGTLASLRAEADLLRAELARLRVLLAAGGRPVPPGYLLAANERLVVAALHAESLAETALGELGTLARATQRDALTDTPNRALMLDRIERALMMAERRRSRLAILFLDLDGFKRINDQLGHLVGDEVLQQLARRLEGAVRSSDTVSRQGGDEFLVLLADVAGRSDVALVAAKLLEEVARPVVAGGQPLQLSLSVGIALYPEDGRDRLTLISRADQAMYRAKRGGPGRLAFHGG